jgi:hypothetical protein
MKFLDIIDRSFVGRLVQSRLNILEQTDPNRIYVENIRSFYGLPTFAAKYLCEKAVEKGLFSKRYGVVCPNEGRLIITAGNVSELPQTVYCSSCEVLENDRYEFALEECQVEEFYKLNVE